MNQSFPFNRFLCSILTVVLAEEVKYFGTESKSEDDEADEKLTSIFGQRKAAPEVDVDQGHEGHEEGEGVRQ